MHESAHDLSAERDIRMVRWIQVKEYQITKKQNEVNVERLHLVNY